MGFKTELETFRATLPPELTLGSAASGAQPGSAGVRTLFLNNWYFHILILIFRPFVVFHAQWQRYHRLSVSTHPERIPASRRQLPPWILSACAICVDAARELLLSLVAIIETNELVRRLGYTCFYVECGAFLLIFNMLRDPHGEGSEDARVLAKAIEAMEKMLDTRPRNISLFAIKRMLALVQGAELGDGETPEIVDTPGNTVGSLVFVVLGGRC